MNDDILHRALGSEDELMPSSGFVAGVMERVHAEAAAPPPIPFPWKRALPGFVLAAGALGWGVVELVRMSAVALHDPGQGSLPVPTGAVQELHSLGWVALALGVALAGWLGARRVSGDSGLM